MAHTSRMADPMERMPTLTQIHGSESIGKKFRINRTGVKISMYRERRPNLRFTSSDAGVTDWLHTRLARGDMPELNHNQSKVGSPRSTAKLAGATPLEGAKAPFVFALTRALVAEFICCRQESTRP